MANSTHSIEQEELMAYLDGELPADSAARVAAHLEQCAECRVYAAESRALTQRLLEWQVEPAPAGLTDRVTAALHEATLKPGIREIPLISPPHAKKLSMPRWAWAMAGATCVLVLMAAVTIPNLFRTTAPTAQYQMAEERTRAPRANAPAAAGIIGGVVAEDKMATPGGGKEPSPLITVPMIVRTASLKLQTRDFDKTRDALEQVVRRHRGYSAQLTAGSESGSAHTLSATFRVPADQLDAAIAEIKQLADVQQESQGGEEVTEQYVDLTARLSNARRTEQQLLDILEKRTGKLSEVLEVEQELARVREQIERMQAELKNLENRVSFSTLQVELREEYKEQLSLTPSLGRRLGNAVVDGFRTAADSLVGLVMFLLSVGPFVLLWGLILFWPARYLWRRLRRVGAQK